MMRGGYQPEKKEHEQTASPPKMSGVPSIEEDLEIIEIIEIPVVPKILPVHWLRMFAGVECMKKRLDDMRQEIERIKKRSGWERVNERMCIRCGN